MKFQKVKSDLGLEKFLKKNDYLMLRTRYMRQSINWCEFFYFELIDTKMKEYFWKTAKLRSFLDYLFMVNRKMLSAVFAAAEDTTEMANEHAAKHAPHRDGKKPAGRINHFSAIKETFPSTTVHRRRIRVQQAFHFLADCFSFHLHVSRSSRSSPLFRFAIHMPKCLSVDIASSYPRSRIISVAIMLLLYTLRKKEYAPLCSVVKVSIK